MSDASAPAATPSLFEWAGGADALRRLIHAFYDRVERDELLSPFFPGGVSDTHRDHVAAWWVEVFGGPPAIHDRVGRLRIDAVSPPQPRDHRRAAASVRVAHESRRRRRTVARRSRVPVRFGRVPRVGHPARFAELPAGCRGRGARAGAALGLGRGTSVPSRLINSLPARADPDAPSTQCVRQATNTTCRRCSAKRMSCEEREASHSSGRGSRCNAGTVTVLVLPPRLAATVRRAARAEHSEEHAPGAVATPSEGPAAAATGDGLSAGRVPTRRTGRRTSEGFGGVRSGTV